MKSVFSLRRRPYLLAMLAVLLIGFAITGIWRSRATQKRGAAPSSAELKRNLHEQIKSGVGTEVRFAGSAGQIRESVDSVAGFIQERTGLGMSQQTKASLGEMEQAALESGRRIETAELSAALAETISERIATLTDGEIARAEASLNRSGGDVSLRASGLYRLPKEEFANEAKALRGQLMAGDGAAGNAIRMVVQSAVEERVTVLSEALSDKFGSAPREGLTPLQAFVVTYSVLTDDNLAQPTATLKQMSQQSLDHPMERGARTDLPYGPQGRLFSAPVQFFFNQEVMGRFLGRLEKGGNER